MENKDEEMMRLIMREGEAIQQEVKEGNVLENTKENTGQESNTELLLGINKKLDMILAAQDISME